MAKSASLPVRQRSINLICMLTCSSQQVQHVCMRIGKRAGGVLLAIDSDEDAPVGGTESGVFAEPHCAPQLSLSALCVLPGRVLAGGLSEV
jgi:hypothetical protein